MVNNLNVIEIYGWIGPMSMTIWITAKQMQKYNKIILLKKLLQFRIFVRPVQKGLELFQRPLIQKRRI